MAFLCGITPCPLLFFMFVRVLLQMVYASVYQVYPVSRKTGEGRAECLGAWGAGFGQEGAGGGGGGGCGRGNLICARKQ